MIRSLLRFFRRSSLDFSELEPIQPRVKPDRAATEALDRQRAALAYQPEHGFLVTPVIPTDRKHLS